jgi:hypothetical protein
MHDMEFFPLAALVAPQKLSYFGDALFEGVSSLDLGRRQPPRGPFFWGE